MAVETSADLLNQLRDEVGFSVKGGDATLLGWLNARHRRMVARSKCYRRRTVIAGGTVATQPDYLLPSDVIEVSMVEVGGVRYDRSRRRDVIEVSMVEVGGVRYDRSRRRDVIDVRNLTAIFLSVTGNGIVAQGANASGQEVLTLYPTPDVSGTEIAVFGPVRAPELQVTGVSGATNSPVVPAEFFDALVHGAAAIGVKRTESRHGEGQAYTSEFDDACEELRRQVRRRWNTGPSRIRIEWPA